MELRKAQLITDNIPVGLHLYHLEDLSDDRTLRMVYANPVVKALTGIGPEDVVGKTLDENFSGLRAQGIPQRYAEVVRTQTAITLEDIAYGDNRIFLASFLIKAFPLPGNMVGIAFENITERKQADADREKLQEQLNQAQKMESVGRLAGGVAHDFNNMLGVILGHTGLALLRTDDKHKLCSDLKEIQNAAKRSANLTKQLLTFARKEIISPKQLDLNDTVESMLNMLRRLIGEDIDLVWKPSAHLWPVKMDPSQIDQILANLCINARDAISGVGKLTIETGRKTFDEEYCKEHAGFIPGDFVLLAVSDNGCGMDKEILDNLFEPFFTTKAVGKGTGLGLATIYGIVKQNNGFINVYSELSQGSTFNIYLPRLVADEDTDKAVPEKKAAAGGTETILLVEDEPTILRMTRMMLERKGYTVLSAAAPSAAMEKATHHSGPIDLLMTDVVMPEMNGRDLAGQIVHLYPDIRLLFMSGYTSNVIARKKIERQLEELNRTLSEMARIDGLTGIPNRRYFDEFFEKEWKRLARVENRPFSMILADIDFFKNYNDNYGHQKGDDCLIQVGKALKEIILRPCDIAARYGGEEFALLLPETDIEGAETVGERARQAILDLRIRHEFSNIASQITMSFGGAMLVPTQDNSPADLVVVADKMLYKAKETGRNKLILAQG
jgi:diguanylate cyclase (GGDEF)-like protein